MQSLAEEVGQVLLDRGYKLATAESCTGGWVSQEITSVAGSSAWFDAGFVTYSNRAKHRSLGVPAELIETLGAVSGPVVEAMASGAIAHSEADVAVSISGVAGPDGGSLEKPVGTVWIGWAFPEIGIESQRFQFSGDREQVISQAVDTALTGLIGRLKNN